MSTLRSRRPLLTIQRPGSFQKEWSQSARAHRTSRIPGRLKTLIAPSEEADADSGGRDIRPLWELRCLGEIYGPTSGYRGGQHRERENHTMRHRLSSALYEEFFRATANIFQELCR